MRALLVMLVMVGVAHAGEPSEEQIVAGMVKAQELMKQAEQAEKAAREADDPAGYDACGEAYLTARAHLRSIGVDDMVPETTYNAAICFTWGGSADRALALFVELERLGPKHPLVMRALMHTARLRRLTGDLEGAAADLELVATRYAGEAEARDALGDAIYFHDVLGDRKAMRRAAERWIKLFGRKDPRRAAELALRLALPREGHKKPADTIRATQAWLKIHGGRDRLLAARAYLALGEAELAASCPVKVDAHGLCLAAPWTPPPPLPPMTYAAPKLVAVPRRKVLAHCAPDATQVEVRTRDPRGVARAQAALKQAVFAAEAAHDQSGAAAHFAARARLALATVPVEEALALTMPTLRFGAIGGVPDPASRKALATWFDAWDRALTRAQDALAGGAPSGRAPGVELTATGRASWLLLASIDALRAAPMPPRPPGLDDAAAVAWRDAYCDALTRALDPFRERAFQQASFCLARANQLGLVDEAAGCLAIYERFQGATREALPQPAAAAVVLDLAP